MMSSEAGCHDMPCRTLICSRHSGKRFLPTFPDFSRSLSDCFRLSPDRCLGRSGTFQPFPTRVRNLVQLPSDAIVYCFQHHK
jgi:hypothetical protein